MSDDEKKDEESSASPDKPEAEEDAAEKEASEEETSKEEASESPDEEVEAGRRRSRRRPTAEREVEPLLAEEPPLPKPNYVFLAVASVIFLALDLGTKHLAVKKLSSRPNDKYVVIKNFFNFDLAQNKGGAWGLLGDQPDHIRLPFFFIISALAVVFIVSLYRKLEPRQTALKWALPLVLGGALGNLIDRLRHQYVVDFIDWYVVLGDKPNHWPTFNIADVWIVVGVGLMVVDMFTPRKRAPRAPRVEIRPKAKSGESKEEVGA